MRINGIVFLGLLFLLGATCLEGQNRQVAFPLTAEMDRYPLQSDSTISDEEIIRMGLHVDTLKSPWTGLNWYRGVAGGRFVYEILPVGTVVLADEDNKSIYKFDCLNRLVTLEECPGCVPAQSLTQIDRLFPETFQVNMPREVTLRLSEDSREALEKLGDFTIPTVSMPTQSRSWWSHNWGWVVGPVTAGVLGGAVYCLVSDDGCFKQTSNVLITVR